MSGSSATLGLSITPAEIGRLAELSQVLENVAVSLGVLSTSWLAIIAWRAHKLNVRAEALRQNEANRISIEERRNATKLHARTLCNEYISLCIENPVFSIGSYSKINCDPMALIKYRWFVDKLIWACEEILVAYSGEGRDDWIEWVDFQLNNHREYFLSGDFKSLNVYLPETQERLVKAGVSNA